MDLTIALIEKEVNKLCKAPLKESELKKSKQQFKNQLRMAEENKNALMVYNGKQMLLHNTVQPLNTYLNLIDSVHAEDLQRTAIEIIQYDQLSLLKIVPV